jgi:hypothetical protein
VERLVTVQVEIVTVPVNVNHLLHHLNVTQPEVVEDKAAVAEDQAIVRARCVLILTELIVSVITPATLMLPPAPVQIRLQKRAAAAAAAAAEVLVLLLIH